MKRREFQDLMTWAPGSSGEDIPAAVYRIVRDVRARGDEAVLEYTRLLDGCRMPDFRVPEESVRSAEREIDEELRGVMRRAVDNLERFARAQMKECRAFDIEIEPGVSAGQRVIPVRRVGVYVPGGRHPLVSSLLMGVVPARVAGVAEIVVCSPPRRDGTLPPALRAAASMAKVDEVYSVGGAQAIAALAYGTATIPAVDKIVGPGNRYVTAAKRMVYGQVGIEFPAGPTEILIIADRSADPGLVAADLLAQAEHDVDARCGLIARDPGVVEDVERELAGRLSGEPEGGPVRVALDRGGWSVTVDSDDAAVALANHMAPEHLELMVEDPARMQAGLRNYGSLFVGPWSAEVLGDYSSGLNHVLPTGGASRYTGGLSVRDFIKFSTVLTAGPDGFRRIGPPARILARTEGLVHHARAVDARERAADRG